MRGVLSGSIRPIIPCSMSVIIHTRQGWFLALGFFKANLKLVYLVRPSSR